MHTKKKKKKKKRDHSCFRGKEGNDFEKKISSTCTGGPRIELISKKRLRGLDR